VCGRFIQISNPERIRAMLGDCGIDPGVLLSFRPRYNVAPSQEVLAVLNTAPPRISSVLWGLIPHWSRDTGRKRIIINARAETVSSKPSFRDALGRRRCIVFADGFYEWKRGNRPKTPYLVRMKDMNPFGIAGLFDVWMDRATRATLRTCTLVTTQANGLVSLIHDRMPAILAPASYKAWLSHGEKGDGELTSLLAPYPPHLMEAFPVSPRVNDPSWDSPACIQPA
jgi:putative SOS response-associated peptidase YedK